MNNMIDVLKQKSQENPDQVWVSLGSDGEILGYYIEGIHNIPEGSMPISSEQWQQNLSEGATHISEGRSIRKERASDAVIVQIMEKKWRDDELSFTDRFMLPDFNITEELRAEVIAYRQALRDMPETGIKPTRPVGIN